MQSLAPAPPSLQAVLLSGVPGQTQTASVDALIDDAANRALAEHNAGG